MMTASVRRNLCRIALAFAGAIALVAATAAAVLAHPQPLFAYHLEQGRLQIWSDRPFDPDQGRRVLADIERRVAQSAFTFGGGTHRIFIANAEWRRRLVFLWNYGAAGVNYYPLRNVFIRAS